jgi:hypothetical protein
MDEEKKRDLIRFITSKVMDWHVNDFGEYCRNDNGQRTGYIIRRFHLNCFDPIDDANCRDAVVERMYELGFRCSTYVYQELSLKGDLSKTACTYVLGGKTYMARLIHRGNSNIVGLTNADSMGETVCLAVEQAIRNMMKQDKEYHGN